MVKKNKISNYSNNRRMRECNGEKTLILVTRLLVRTYNDLKKESIKSCVSMNKLVNNILSKELS